MSGRFEFYTLGGLTIQRDGLRLTKFETRKMEALLVYLAHTGRTQSRDTLGELLWNDRSQEQSLANIRVLLHRLRPVVELITSRRTVTLAQPYWIDTHELSDCLTSAEAQWRESQTFSQGTIASIEDALSLYQGDFLAGFYIGDARGFEEWVSFEREQMRLRVLKITECLIQVYLAQGAALDGIRQTQRLLQFDPFSEPSHRLLMKLYTQVGQSAQAIAQYEICQSILSQEFGIVPSAETQALYQAIIQMSDRVPADQSIKQTPALPETSLDNSATGIVTSYLPVQNNRFVNRKELAQIAALLDNPACRLLTLTGIGGIGKTRLTVQAATTTAFSHGVYFVPLAGVNSPDFLVSAISQAIKFQFYGPSDPKVQLLGYLRTKHMLIILDNFEHLVEQRNLLSEILATAPSIKLLVVLQVGFPG